MKNWTKLTLMSALALAVLGCQKETGVDNPNYNSETNEVKTNFIFNVSTRQETKQSSAATQASASNTFRGIEQASLMTYANLTTPILPADADAGKFYDLASVASPASLDASNSRRVIELSLPLQTNVLLFYGKAPLGSADETYPNLYDYYGHLDSYTVGKTAGSAVIEQGARLSASDYVKFKTVENLFAGIMSMLLNTKLEGGLEISATDAPSGVDNTYKFAATIPSGGISWENYADASGNSPYATTSERFALENKLSLLYKQLTTINTAGGELRAGSGAAVVRMTQDMLSVLNEIRCAEPLNAAEAVAKYLANKIYNRTLQYYTGTTNNEGAPITAVAFRSVSEIATAYLSTDEVATRPSDVSDITVWPDQAAITAIGAEHTPAKFPTDFNIPFGATYYSFDKTKKRFYYPQQFNVSGMGIPGVASDYNARSYFYPVELLYFGNSPIRATSADKKASDYPNGAGTAAGRWENDGSWSGDWNQTAVQASTRAVAMKYDINYGVALLQTKVKYSADAITAGYINDNNHNVQVEWNGDSALSEQDKHVPVTAGGFQLTGIIVGGQSKRIGWDHLPEMVGSSYEYGFVYDKAIPAAAKSVPASGTSEPNYTLVFDNFHAASQTAGIYTPEASQDIVYVALEFQNNTGMDFYGNHNMIQAGGYFYLIGALNPATAGSITWPTNYVIPPYKADGTSQEVKRVFIQDFLTAATFTLDMNSLHSAYLTVPDLRASSMSLGLSVDLNWETGLNFDNVILGE